MKIDRKEVAHIAQLARLTFEGEQIEIVRAQLNNILDYFDKLQELNTEDIEPTSHAVVLNNVFRNDSVEESPAKERSLKNAPSQEKGCFKVPKVIE